MRRTWRDADLAQKGGPRPSSVSSVVRATTRGLVRLRAVEGLLFAAAIGCATMATAYLSGLERVTVEALVVVGATGVAAGLAWFLEMRTTEARVARKLDRRLRHGGALVTALDLERGGTDDPLARLCVRRVLDKLRTAEARRVLRPSVAPPVLLPLFGVTLLGLTLDARRTADVPVHLPLEGMGSEIEAFGSAAIRAHDEGRIGTGTMGEALAIRQRASDFRLQLEAGERGPDGARPELAREARAVDAQLSELAARLGSDPELSRELERLRARLDAVAAEAERSGRTAAVPESAASPMARAGLGPGPSERPGDRVPATDPAGAGESTSPALASAEGDGTMSRPRDGATASNAAPDSDDTSPTAPGSPPSDEPPAANSGGPAVWWDPVDDPVVEDWLALLQDARRDRRAGLSDPSPNESESLDPSGARGPSERTQER